MHKLHSCTVTGYRRLLLSNIRQITITPRMAVQLILGTNGSGKSSLVEQLSPLPPQSGDFIKGGGKVYVAYLDGRKITCTSKMDSGAGRHSFDVDGEELNPGGTAGVQRELVEKYFRITPAIHDLQRGAEKFHAMNPARRREWFTKMCDADYTFAMSAFETLKQRANWLTGAVKMNQKHLVAETGKIMSEADETRLETEVNALLQELEILQAERMPVPVSSEQHWDASQRALKALNELSLRLLRHRVNAPYKYTEGVLLRDEWGTGFQRLEVPNLEVLDREIERLQHTATDRQAVLVTLNEQFSKYDRQYKLLVQTGAEGVDGIVRQIKELKTEGEQIVRRMRIGLVFPDARVAREALESIETPLTSAINALPVNADRRYGRQRYQELQGRITALNDRIRTLQEQLQRRVAQKEHADLHRGQDKHTCPKCDHSWVVGVNEEQYAQLLTSIKEAEANLKTPMTEREELGVQLKEIEMYFDQYRDVMAFTKNVTSLKTFWDHLTVSQTLFESPAEAVTMVHQVLQDLIHASELQVIEERIKELEKLKVAAEEAGDAKLEDVKNEMELLTDQLGGVTKELAGVSRAITEYSEYRRQLKQAMDMGAEVERMYEVAKRAHWDQVEMFRRECIQSCIDQVEQALALRQESLRAAKMQKAVVAKLQAQVAHDELHEAAAKTMVKALSPTHGLIAQGLLGFIRNFVGQMNTFIGRIWSYPLQIIPTGYNSDNGEQSSELDYKFKMIVEREDNVVPDVAKGSDGIKEMVDLAFMMMSLKHLGLSDSPLFLDEFGRAFDEQHRFAATEEIRWMMENGNHPQLFMISHYMQNYAAFSNAEICVLDDRNITLPSGREFNKHVSIVR